MNVSIFSYVKLLRRALSEPLSTCSRWVSKRRQLLMPHMFPHLERKSAIGFSLLAVFFSAQSICLAVAPVEFGELVLVLMYFVPAADNKSPHLESDCKMSGKRRRRIGWMNQPPY